VSVTYDGFASQLILTRPKQRLRSILAESMKQERGPDFDVYHEVRIRHSSAGREAIKDFGILNLVVRSIHSPFNDNWAESEKLFPWVAVAAPLKVCSCFSLSLEMGLIAPRTSNTTAKWGAFSQLCLSQSRQACLSISTDFSAYPRIVPGCTGAMTKACKTIGPRNGTNISWKR
jgi:hypothetical protein